MSDTQHHSSVTAGSEKSFGIVFAIVFAIVGLWPVINGGEIRIPVIIVAGVFLALAFIFPKILKYPNLLWFKFGLLLGAVVAPVVMALVYFVTIVPFGATLRLMGKDILGVRFDPKAESYWVTRDTPTGSMKNQY